jgi:hypothetical protein
MPYTLNRSRPAVTQNRLKKAGKRSQELNNKKKETSSNKFYRKINFLQRKKKHEKIIKK